MSDEDALLAAIAEHPDEDTPRLAYADWLDEHDRPILAEFIRVQIEISHKETLPRVLQNRYVDLWKRNQELLDNHRDELLGSLAALPKDTKIEFRRGFVSEVTSEGVHARHDLWPRLIATRPLPRLTITRYPSWVREFLGFSIPFVLETWQHHRDIVSAIRTIPDDEEEDEETNFFDDRRAGRVDLHPWKWPRLEQLDISGCRLGNANAAALLRTESFPVLTDIDLSGNELTDFGVTFLLDSGLPRQLKRLILGGNPITDQGAIALVQRWPKRDADKLEHLNLKFTDIGVAGQQALLTRFGGKVDLF